MSHLPDVFFQIGTRPNKGKKVYAWLWVASVLFFLALPSDQPGWVFLAVVLGTGLAFIALAVVNIFTRDNLLDWAVEDAEKGDTQMATDPAALAEKLVREAPASQAKNYDHLELEAIRWLSAEVEGEAYEKAIARVRHRLAELLDLPASEASASPEIVQPQRAPVPADPVAQAQDIIARSFSAPYDGSEHRLEVFAARARQSCAPLLAAGLEEETLDRLIHDHKAQLRAAYAPYR